MASDKYSRDDLDDLGAQDEGKGRGRASRFSRSQTFDFIREYRRHECLWNVGITEYNDKALRSMALRQMAKEFRLPLEAVKKKIHALRSTYLQMRDRVSNVENQEPTLSWYYEMEFLDPVITPRKPMELKRIRARGPRKRSREELEASPEEDEQPEMVLKMEDLAYDENAVSEQEEVYIEYIEQGREESCEHEAEPDTVYTIPETSESPTVATVASTASSQDEFDVFGQSVAAQLKTMPLKHAIPLMGSIQALISESRIKSITSTHK
ncbi:uncharacterized protein LOC132263223 [Phlebotomus argentipes]|uniref:uncharacterized protein LOC132263223 n=1 Tax=Phlebotomus argentipes TaxID=94469 RepID=UPI002892A4CC|nr:uncharacterized protein LOC132263223 [Phlebotomus argentipes]